MMSIRSSALYARAFRRSLAPAGVAIGESRAHRDQDVVGDRGPVAQRLQAYTAALVAVLVIAACSSDDAASRSTTASASSVAPSTTGTSSSTSAPSTSTSTSTSSTLLPSTTNDPRIAAEAQVRAAVEASIAAFRACLEALPNCDVNSLAGTRAGDMLRINAERINEWNAAGYELRDGDQFREVVESVTFSDQTLTRATVVTCGADGSKLVLPGAGPDGGDVVVDGAYTSGRSEWDVRLDGEGVWRPYAAPALGPTESRDVCPPA
jgi:hypothetical protein